MRVECTDCRFSRIASPEGDELPGEIVIRHGRRTGHTLTITPLDGGDDGFPTDA